MDVRKQFTMIQYDVGKMLLAYQDKPCAHKNSPDNNRVAVMIETRDTLWLPLVIKNFCDKLGPTWNIHLFLTAKAKKLVDKTLPDCKFKVSLVTHPVRFILDNYSMLLRSQEFWSHIKEDKVLIFQTDCILLQPIPTWAEDFDMIGAPCGQVKSETEFIMNGGFSLRSRQAMMELALDHVDNVDENRPEDVFFRFQFEEQPGKFKLPDVQTAARFASEAVCQQTLETVVGIHGTDKYFLDSGNSSEPYMRDRFDPFRITII